MSRFSTTSPESGTGSAARAADVTRIASRTLLVKGLEYDHVVIADLNKMRDPRNLYVALSRARKSAIVVGGRRESFSVMVRDVQVTRGPWCDSMEPLPRFVAVSMNSPST